MSAHPTASARPPASAPPRALVADPLPLLTRRRAAALFDDEAGAATAEYAVATIARLSGVTHGRAGHEVPPRRTARGATIRPRVVRVGAASRAAVRRPAVLTERQARIDGAGHDEPLGTGHTVLARDNAALHLHADVEDLAHLAAGLRRHRGEPAARPVGQRGQVADLLSLRCRLGPERVVCGPPLLERGEFPPDVSERRAEQVGRV